jgi:NAD(P)-dependent dehydrogenase (short-subunit alcohol dehydrogenase family)
MPAPATPARAVLITGCSSGIGAATARHLASLGWPVYATARKPETLAPLGAAGCRTLALDVTDEASMRAAVTAVEEEHGAVGVLVNNAGYSQTGAIESVPLDRVRAQFETNVFGLVRMCVDVVIIEPGIIVTGFGEHARPGVAGEGPYAAFEAAVAQAYVDVYEKGPMRRLGGPPEAVARRIAKAIAASRPRARYTVTASAKALIAQKALLPDAGWDAVMRTTFPQPRPE